MGDPTGHLKSFANSSMLANGPMTRKRPGAWKPVVIRSLIASLRYTAHQVFAALSQNNCKRLIKSYDLIQSMLYRSFPVLDNIVYIR